MNDISLLIQVQAKLKEGHYISEAAVSQGIVLQLLSSLNWPIFDTSVVIPEYTISGKRVDYCLCSRLGKPAAFIEVKAVGHSLGADEQLFGYAFHAGIPFAVLTDGQEWNFYLPGEQGDYNERRVYKLDLLERSPEEASKKLNRYLEYNRFTSGEALEDARRDYRSAARRREANKTIPKAWNSLVDSYDTNLIDLISEKVEDLCGYKPSLEACSDFLQKVSYNTGREVTPPKPPKPSNPKPSGSNIVEYKGQKYIEKTARGVLIRVMKILIESDDGFTDRFLARRHGKKRRYLSRKKHDLYSNRPDLSEVHSVEVSPGWWVGTNYSKSSIKQILDLALEVSNKDVKSNLSVHFNS